MRDRIKRLLHFRKSVLSNVLSSTIEGLFQGNDITPRVMKIHMTNQ